MTARYIYVADLYPRTDPVNGARLVRFTKTQGFELREDANGPGLGLFVIRGDCDEAQFIEAPTPGKVGAQYIKGVRIDTETVDGATLSGFAEKVVGGLFLEKGDFEALTKRQTRKLTFTGPGPESFLERAIMANVTYVAGAEGPFDGEWHWYFSDPGEILHRAIQEANEASRPQSPIPGVTVDFTQLVDSSGNAWAGHGTTWLFTFPSGRPITELIARLREHGLYVRVDPDTFVVSAWPTAGYRAAHDFTGTAWAADVIRFQDSSDDTTANGNILDDAKRGVEVYKRRSHLLVGKNDTWEWIEADPAPDVVWEGSFTVEDEEGTAFPSFGEIQINARDDAGDTARIRFKCQASAPSTGEYLPFDDILPNYLVTAHSGTTEWDWNEADFPVASVTLQVQRTGIGKAWVELGATFRDASQSDPSVGPVPYHTHPPNPRICRDTPGTSLEWVNILSGSPELSVDGSAGIITLAASAAMMLDADTVWTLPLEVLLKARFPTGIGLIYVSLSDAITTPAPARYYFQMDRFGSLEFSGDGAWTQGTEATDSADEIDPGSDWFWLRYRLTEDETSLAMWMDGSSEPAPILVSTDNTGQPTPENNIGSIRSIIVENAGIALDSIELVSGLPWDANTDTFTRTVSDGWGTSEIGGGSESCIHGGPAANSGNADEPCGKCVAAGNHEHDYVAAGGTTGEVLAKASDADWDTEWVTPGGGSPATDPGDIADPTMATAEDVANKLNDLMAAMRAAGSLV